MMQAAEAAARAAMLEAAQREGISLGPLSSSTNFPQQVQLDDQQIMFINELQQSNSNGEISRGDQHLLHEVMGLHHGQLNDPMVQGEGDQETPCPLQIQQQQQQQPDEREYHQQVEDTFPFQIVAQHIPDEFLQQFLLQQQQQQHPLFDQSIASTEEFLETVPEEHYLTIAQNGRERLRV
jgi:hypothetical protein